MRTSLQTLNIVPNSHQDPVPTPLSSLKPKWSKRYVSPYGADLCNLLGHEGIQFIAGGYGRRVTLRRAAPRARALQVNLRPRPHLVLRNSLHPCLTNFESICSSELPKLKARWDQLRVASSWNFSSRTCHRCPDAPERTHTLINADSTSQSSTTPASPHKSLHQGYTMCSLKLFPHLAISGS